MVWRISGFTIGLLLVSMASASSQNRPSFDCAEGKEYIEKAICQSTALSTLDREIAAAYGVTRKLLDPIAQNALKNDQKRFLAGREIALTERYGNLTEFMETRLKLLRSLQAGSTGMAAADFLGEWKNQYGYIRIVQGKSDTVDIKINSAAMVTGKWLCGIKTTAPVDSGSIAFTYEKVSIDITRDGSALIISEKSPSEDGQKPYCGNNGGVGGHYFKVK